MKDHVKLLVIGDNGVGKSSLISSYISRHFPSEVPPVMTDAVIPSQTTSNDVCVTVMDSSARPGDSDVLKQKLLAADSIIALYDVTRPDTFESLIQVWFPLIKEVYGENHSKPVVVVGTKTDLLMEDPDTDRLREMLEMFPFVLVCLRCSALQLLDVEDIFQYGVDAVTYPLEPIFDIFTHEFKPACRRAFLRIFRALDLDNDNLLSDSEMRDTELKCFSLQISDEELVAMKRQIAQGVEGGLRDEMVTFEGFLGLVKMIVEETSLRIPWQILRRFDYDDDLDFMIPEEVSETPTLAANQLMELSSDASDFLLSMARIAHHEYHQQQRPGHENDSAEEPDETSGSGVLTWDALNYILSVVAADVVHPWVAPPSFQCVWREDSAEQQSASRSLQQSVLLSSLPHMGANISFDAWLTQWHVLAVNHPVLVQELLFRLGYIERGDLGTVMSSGPIEQIARYVAPRKSIFGSMFSDKHKPPNARSTVSVVVLGDNCVGKSSFVWNLSSLPAPGSLDVEKGLGTEKPQDTVVVGGCRSSRRHSQDSSDRRNLFQVSRDSGTTRFRKSLATQNKFEHLQNSFYVSAAAIPLEHVGVSQEVQSSSGKVKKDVQRSVLEACDVAVLMFQCGDMKSLQIALQVEKSLPSRLPRLFLASKCDLVQSKTGGSDKPSSSSRNLQAQHEIVYQEAALHLQQHDLPELVFLSTATGEGVAEAVAAVLTVAEEPLRGVPLKLRSPQSSSLLTSSIAVLSFFGLSTALSYYLFNYHQKELRQVLKHLRAVPVLRDLLVWAGMPPSESSSSSSSRA